MWMRPIFCRRELLGEHILVDELRQDLESFHKYFRMDPWVFDILLKKVTPYIQKCDTNYRKAIPPSTRLAITLRFLATGDERQTISFSFRTGYSTVCEIINETSDVIWKVLVDDYMKAPSNEKEWQSIAHSFSSKWDFPNCIGAIDGKHVSIQAPSNSGSEYYNYKGTYSIVLMAVCDAKYNFIMIDIGDSGRHSDGGVFSNCNFGKEFLGNNLKIPTCMTVPNSDIVLPYCIVGDNAFPLKCNLMRPYPGKNLSVDRKVFNYRLSRARRVIENAFGILVARWRIFKAAIHAEPNKAIVYTKAACVLHNFLNIHNTETYCPRQYVDQEDEAGNVQPGEWRNDAGSCMEPLGRTGSNSYQQSAEQVRETWKNYFNSTAGMLPWQFRVVQRL